jgi:hypothetical protein
VLSRVQPLLSTCTEPECTHGCNLLSGKRKSGVVVVVVVVAVIVVVVVGRGGGARFISGVCVEWWRWR